MKISGASVITGISELKPVINAGGTKHSEEDRTDGSYRQTCTADQNYKNYRGVDNG